MGFHPGIPTIQASPPSWLSQHWHFLEDFPLWHVSPQTMLCQCAVQGKYVSLGMASAPSDWRNFIIIVGTIGGLLGANWSVKFYRSHSSDRKRTAALKSLQ